MSTSSERSIGAELVRIIRDEIRAYDERKDEAARLRRIADEAVARADQAATNVRDSKPNSVSAAISAAFGDTNAQAIDKLFPRQGKHVNFAMGGNLLDRGVVQQTDVAAAAAKAANDELLRNQQQSAEKTAPWRPRGAPPATRGWWPRKKG